MVLQQAFYGFSKCSYCMSVSSGVNLPCPHADMVTDPLESHQNLLAFETTSLIAFYLTSQYMNRHFTRSGVNDYTPKAQSSLPRVFVDKVYGNFIEIKFYWKTTILIHESFTAAFVFLWQSGVVERSNRDSMAYKPKKAFST